LKLYEEEFDSDPKNAIKNLTKRQMEREEAARRQLRLEAEARQAAEYYHQQKKENQDFARLEPKMQAIAQEYADLVNKDMINSVKALKLLHLAARGASVDDYVAEASSRAKKEGATIRQEKQQAFSEGTRSEGQKSVSFKELSLEEMEKALGRAD
jgi:DNA repair exonuclease SbcCD ATPase subunit